jgi:hypothetical protein
MNITQLKASRALWLRRERFRRRRYRWYKHKSKRNLADRRRLRGKWWNLYVKARNQRVARDRQIAAYVRKTKPKPSARAKAVAYAKSHVGQVESPPGSNRGGGIIGKCQIMFLGRSGYAWCGCFVGAVMRHVGVQGITSRIAGVAGIEDDARANRAPFRGWSDRVTERTLPGELVCIGRKGQHVEMVVKGYADGSADTVAGNVSNGVRVQRRSAAQIRGIAHINYPG